MDQWCMYTYLNVCIYMCIYRQTYIYIYVCNYIYIGAPPRWFYVLKLRVQHIPILLQKRPSKIMHQESVISLNLDLLRPKIMQLENVQILEFSIFDFPLPIFWYGGPFYTWFFFSEKLELWTGNPKNQPTGETAEKPPPFQTPPVEACGPTSCEPFGTRAWRDGYVKMVPCHGDL